MKHERISNRRDRSTSPATSGGKQQRGYASDPFLALLATLVLIAATAFFSIGLPALEVATNPAYGSTAILADLEPGEEEEPPEPADRAREPFIADDLRTEGMMYAFADVFCPIEC